MIIIFEAESIASQYRTKGTKLIVDLAGILTKSVSFLFLIAVEKFKFFGRIDRHIESKL